MVLVSSTVPLESKSSGTKTVRYMRIMGKKRWSSGHRRSGDMRLKLHPTPSSSIQRKYHVTLDPRPVMSPPLTWRSYRYSEVVVTMNTQSLLLG